MAPEAMVEGEVVVRKVWKQKQAEVVMSDMMRAEEVMTAP